MDLSSVCTGYTQFLYGIFFMHLHTQSSRWKSVFLSVGLYAIIERVGSEVFLLIVLRLLSSLANY